MAENKELTIFDAGTKERQEAIKNLLKGKTPINEVKKRPMRGGGEANYVNTYYMTRQIALLTGFRWRTECLEERFLPNDTNPREIGAKMLVTIWDIDHNEYSHQSWGQKDVARYTKDDPRGNYKAGDPISIFDDIKAAYSDGIKKCLSYFGIANDIYGGKELEFFATDEDEENSTADMGGADAARAFGKFLSEKHILVSKALEFLGVASLSEITDFKAAYNKINSGLEKGGGKLKKD